MSKTKHVTAVPLDDDGDLVSLEFASRRLYRDIRDGTAWGYYDDDGLICRGGGVDDYGNMIGYDEDEDESLEFVDAETLANKHVLVKTDDILEWNT